MGFKMKLTEGQKRELERREEVYKCTCGITDDHCQCEVQINYGSKCSCGYNFDGDHHYWDCDCTYWVGGVQYPIISGESNCEGDCAWHEDHKCPDCGEDYSFYTGN
jgi:hypothetical protein